MKISWVSELWSVQEWKLHEISINTQSKGHNSETNIRENNRYVHDTSSRPNIHSYKVSWRYPKPLLSNGAYKRFWGKMFKKNNHRVITQKQKRVELSFLYVTHRLHLIHTPITFHEDIPNRYQVKGWTRMKIKSAAGMHHTRHEIFWLQRQSINQGPYLWKIKCSCLYQNLIYKISYFQIKGHNSVDFGQI